MKRSADNSAGPAHNADTRLRKLKTDNSGRPILPVDKKKEKAEDKAKDAVAETLEGLAVTLENDPNGQGRELWNNPGVGHALQHLVKAVEARADEHHVRDDVDVAAERPGLAVANLSVADVKLRLTVGIVDQLQDPMFDAGPEFFPIFQLNSLAASGMCFCPVLVNDFISCFNSRCSAFLFHLSGILFGRMDDVGLREFMKRLAYMASSSAASISSKFIPA